MTTDITYDSFFMDHASGALTPGMALLATEHTRLHPSGQAAHSAWSTIGGALLESIEPSGGMACGERASKVPMAPRERTAYVRRDFDAMKWKTGFSGVSYAPGRISGTKYMRLNANASAPAHTHSALEATLVLSGRLSDGERTYEMGEIAFGLPGERHKPAAVGGEACICFVAQDPRPFWRLT